MFQQVTKVVTYYFSTIYLLPYYFLPQNTPVQHIFVSFSVLFSEKSKKICQFFAIFSLCVSMI